MANRGLLEQLDALQFEIYPIPVSPELLIAPGCPQQNTGSNRCLSFSFVVRHMKAINAWFVG